MLFKKGSEPRRIYYYCRRNRIDPNDLLRIFRYFDQKHYGDNLFEFTLHELKLYKNDPVSNEPKILREEKKLKLAGFHIDENHGLTWRELKFIHCEHLKGTEIQLVNGEISTASINKFARSVKKMYTRLYEVWLKKQFGYNHNPNPNATWKKYVKK